MNQKTTYGILLAVAIALVAVWWARPVTNEVSGAADADRPGAQAPLFDFGNKEIAAVEIAAPDLPAIGFAKDADKWVLTAPLRAPATGYLVDSIVTRIRDLKPAMTFAPGDADRPGEDLTGLNKPLRVKLTDVDGRVYVLKIGSAVPAARETYVQRDDSETLYVVPADLRPDFDRSLNDYRHRQVCEFATADAVRIEVSGEHAYRLARAGDQWTVEQPVRGRADRNAVDAMLRALSGLSVQTFADDAPKNLAVYGLERPAYRITVECEKKTPKPAPATQTTQPAEPEFETTPYTVAVALGAKAGDKRFGMLAQDDAPWVFQIADSLTSGLAPELTTLRDKTLARLEVNRAQRAALTTAEGTVELSRSEGKWSVRSPALAGLPGDQAEFAAVDDLLRAAANLRATSFESGPPGLADYGFDSPRATLEITVEGTPEPLRLVFGRQTPSATAAYVRNEGEQLVAVVKADDVKPFLVGPLNFVNRDMLRFDRSRATRLEVTRGLRSASLAQKDGVWRVEGPIEADAEITAVNNVLADLSTLRARRVVGTPQQRAAFGLDRPPIVARLTVAAAPPETQPTTAPAPPDDPPAIYVLSAARKDDKAYVYVEGAPTICEVDGRVFDNLDAELVEHAITRMQQSAIVAVTVAQRGRKPFTFEKKGERWRLAGEPTFAADQAKVDALLAAFCGLKTDRYAAYRAPDLRAFGLNDPDLTVEYRTEDGARAELRISGSGPADDAAGRKYGVVAGSGRVFLLTTGDLAKFDLEVASFQQPS